MYRPINTDKTLVANKGIDKVALSCLFLILGFGIVMVLSSSALISQKLTGSQSSFFLKHIISLVIGLIAFFITIKLPLGLIQKVAFPFFIISILIMFFIFIPGLGTTVNGATRWIRIGGMNFQPSELLKLSSVIFFSGYIANFYDELTDIKFGLGVPSAILGLIGILLLLQPDFGSTAVISAVVFSMFFIVARLRFILLWVGGGISLLIMLAVMSPYRMQRLSSFMDPFSHQYGSGHQLIQSLIAVGSGGGMGYGLGAGKQKLFYLPEAHTDFIFAVIAEELGFLGVFVLISLFCILAYRFFLIVNKSVHSIFYCCLALGCTLLLCIPIIFNIGVVIGLLPTKGLVLPFISYGGSAMLVNLVIAGVLLNMSRYDFK